MNLGCSLWSHCFPWFPAPPASPAPPCSSCFPCSSAPLLPYSPCSPALSAPPASPASSPSPAPLLLLLSLLLLLPLRPLTLLLPLLPCFPCFPCSPCSPCSPTPSAFPAPSTSLLPQNRRPGTGWNLKWCLCVCMYSGQPHSYCMKLNIIMTILFCFSQTQLRFHWHRLFSLVSSKQSRTR